MYLDQSFVIRLVNFHKFHIGTWIFDDNSVCVATSQLNSTKIQHYDSKGLINEFILNTFLFLTNIASINQHEMILLDKNNSRVEYLNLITKQKRFVEYNFKSKSEFNHHIISFLKTNLFCIVQNFKQNQESKINISYFDKNLNKVSEYLFDNADRLSRFFVLGMSSKVAFLKIKETNTIKIEIVDSTQTYIFECAFPTLGDYVIKQLFEFSPNKLILYCESSTPHKLIQWNLEEKTMKPLLIEGIKQDNIFKIYFGGDYFYFLMLQAVNNNNNLFIVDKNTLEVIHKNNGHKDYCHQYKIEMNKGYSRLIQIQTNRQNFTTVGVRVLGIVNQKQLFLSILEQIGGFDEEMLRNIVCAIQYKKE